jgi:homoserine dehydrogenase
MNDQNRHHQGLVILGASGNIGTRLIERMTDRDSLETEPQKIVAIADSTHFYVNLQGLAAADLRANPDTKANVKKILAQYGEPHGGDVTLIAKEIKRLISDSKDTCTISEASLVYIDLTDSKSTKPLYEAVLNHSQSALVAVSKKVLGYANQAQFSAYIKTRRLEILPTVGAGMDALNHLLDYNTSCENLIEVSAMVSGTTLSICQGFESEAYQAGHLELSDLIETAWKNGDTEPYADTDVGESESDTWVKARIMALSAGLPALPENITSGRPFVPQSLGKKFNKQTMEAYLQALKKEVDAPMRTYVQAHLDATLTLRHMARITIDSDGNEHISVGLEPVARDSEFATSDQNVVIIKDNTETVIFKKPGAGRDVTCKSIEKACRQLQKA